MMPLLIYIAKASACLAILYGFYRLVLQGEKTLHFNRFYLLSALVISLALPAVNATVYLPAFLAREATIETVVPVVTPELLVNTVLYQTSETAPVPANPVNWPMVMFIAYLLVAGVLLIRFIWNISQMMYLILRSQVIAEHGVKYVLVDNTEGLPYSFLQFVFVCKAAFLEGEMPDEVLAHEKAHSIQLHTLDIIIVELIKIVFWFNPFVFLFKRAIQLNHEYLADSDVLSACDLAGYQKTLLNHVSQRHSLTLVSNFNYSFTKKRLIMMTKLRTNRLRFGGKIALLLPVLFAAFLVSATCQTPEPPQKEVKKVLAEEEAKAAKEEAVKEMIIVKEKQVEAMKDLDEAKKEFEEQKKIVKMKKIQLDSDSEDFEKDLEKAMEELEGELEGMDIDLENLMKQIREGIEIDVEEDVDGVKKCIKIVNPGMDEDGKMEFDIDIDFDFDDLEGLQDLETLIELKHLDGGENEMIFIGGDGEHIEMKNGGKEKIIIMKSGDGEIMELQSGGNEKIVIIKDGNKEIHEIHECGHHENHSGHKEKIVIINGDETEEQIWIHEGDYGDIEKEIKVIIKECEGDSKSKKKKKKK
ncbi:MAG: hypothetical protein GY751_16970 [Bacteroidetes bacterium]|nr:hypothetical protein [Bacteroidota bacterium]